MPDTMHAAIIKDFRYTNRIEAGYVLADLLKKYKGKRGVVLAIPRGGIPVAKIVAEQLSFKLDLALSKKIGHPLHKEYAIGAVSLTDSFIVNHEEVPESYIATEEQKIKENLKKTYQRLMEDKQPENLTSKIVIIIDDGIATGNTMLSTIRMIKKQLPQKLIVAVPVASKNAIDNLSNEIDEIVCPLIPDHFIGVGRFYINFDQVSDKEAKYYLQDK